MSDFRTSLIVRSAVKKLLLEQAKATKFHKFTRVSADTLNELNEVVRLWCVKRVHSLPSVGKTI